MGFQPSRRKTNYRKRSNSQRGQHPRRITEQQRSATEEAYLNSLRQQPPQRVLQQSYHKTPMDKKERSYRLLIGCLITSVIIVGVILLFVLFATYISPPENNYPVPSPIATDTTGDFCQTHTCIPNFSNGKGSIIECRDGEYSHSGGLPGACSDHGGEMLP